MIYAPIIIATLNRYEHLRRCITSLQKNAWAKYTELYISLDYPPEEFYKEGYQKIKKYLEADIDGFMEVHIYMQPKNLGVVKNFIFLRNKVFEKYDRVITTEDDNEFSPNFIEYMDKGLEIFQDDPDILFINGYVEDKEWNGHAGNVMKMSSGKMWGCGLWKNKYKFLEKKLTRKFFDGIGRNPYYIWKLYYYSRDMLWWYVHRYLCDPYPVLFREDGEMEPMDINIFIYSIIKNKYFIAPIKSKVRNWGRDGSGVNCGTDPEYHPESIEIDEEKSFQYKVPQPFRVEKDNRLIRAGINGHLEFRYNVKVLQNWILREILGDKGYHTFLRKQIEYRQWKQKFKKEK